MNNNYHEDDLAGIKALKKRLKDYSIHYDNVLVTFQLEQTALDTVSLFSEKWKDLHDLYQCGRIKEEPVAYYSSTDGRPFTIDGELQIKVEDTIDVLTDTVSTEIADNKAIKKAALEKDNAERTLTTLREKSYSLKY